MKKLFLQITLCTLIAPRLANAINTSDLPEITDPASMVYFNGSGTAQIKHNDQELTVLLEVHFEHPENGQYGSLKFLDQTGGAIATYAMTRVENFSPPSSSFKRVTLTGIEGTKGTSLVSVIFDKKNKCPYRITPISNAPPYFRQHPCIFFQSELRIAPREKTREELTRDSLVQQNLDRIETKRRQELKEAYFRRDAYYAIGILIAVTSILFALWMAPRALRRQRLPHLILFTALALLSTFPPFFLLPVLPAYFWWYYKLYDDDLNNEDLEKKLGRIALWSGVIAAIVFYGIFGIITVLYAAVWFAAGYMAILMIYSKHGKRARCPHCRYYGPNEIVTRKYLDQHITRTITGRHEYDHTEERDDEIIEWYRKKYNLRIEAEQRFHYFRRCEHCGEIYITTHYKNKVLADRDL